MYGYETLTVLSACDNPVTLPFHFHSGWLRLNTRQVRQPDMSVAPEIDTVATRTDSPDISPRVFDVSEIHPDAVTEYIAETTDDCYFERKGGRTYLIAH